MRRFIQSWLINTLAVLVAVYIVRGIAYQQWHDLFIASLLLGILNTVLRPFLMFLALPLVLVTLGLFMLIINALLLYAVGTLLRPHFVVNSFWAAFWGALIISIVSTVLNAITGTGKARLRVERHHRHPAKHDEDGPVIDI